MSLYSRSISQAGSNVILVARRENVLKDVAQECAKSAKESGFDSVKLATVRLDVSDKTQVAKFWDGVPQDLRNVDILGTFP